MIYCSSCNGHGLQECYLDKYWEEYTLSEGYEVESIEVELRHWKKYRCEHPEEICPTCAGTCFTPIPLSEFYGRDE